MPDFHRTRGFVLAAAAALLLLAGLGATDFWAPDEPRYGQVAQEIRSFEHGPSGLVLLHLAGEPYTQKPPLYYWLAALASAASGDRVSEVAARLPSALAGIATVMLTAALARRLVPGRLSPFCAGIVLLTTFRFAHLARRAQLDVLLTGCETAAMLAFWQIDARLRAGAPRPTGGVVAFHLALGAAALTKGPVGWLPVLAIGVYLAWEGRARDLPRLLPVWGLLLSVGPVLVWIGGATALAPGGFFREAVVENLAGRFLSASSHVRPLYYYLYQLPADALPWTLLWPVVAWHGVRALRGGAEERRPWRLLFAWVGVPLIVLSLSSGKRGLYLLPVFPALSLMTGATLARLLERPAGAPAWMGRGVLALGAGLCLGGAAVALVGGVEPAGQSGFGVPAETGVAVAGIAALGMLAAGVARRVTGRSTASLGVGLASLLALELFVFLRIYPSYDLEKSPRPIAVRAAQLTAPDEPVGVFDDEGLAGGIVYYANRRVEILPRPEDVARFLDGGGRYVILERWKLPWLDPVGPLYVHAKARRDRRQLAIVSRTKTAETPEGDPAAPPHL